MSAALPAPAVAAGVIADTILEAIRNGNIEECVTSNGHRFWLFSRGPLQDAKAALRADILREAGTYTHDPHINLTSA